MEKKYFIRDSDALDYKPGVKVFGVNGGMLASYETVEEALAACGGLDHCELSPDLVGDND